jgi:hypothetical protein
MQRLSKYKEAHMSAGDFRKHALLAFAVSLVSILFILPAQAQGHFGSHGFGPTIHGVPPSVTSFGFGGSPGFHGVPPSVTSLNFGNTNFGNRGAFRVHSRPFGFGHHRRNGFFNPFAGDIVAFPYDYSMDVAEPGVDDSMEQDYLGGPTIFDRRGPGPQMYSTPQPQPEQQDYRASVTPSPEPTPQQPVADQPRTVLVFKDGHQQEISNYAIVGGTLYDLSDGRSRKVALAQLDLQATVKQNDSRGVDFELPAASRLN